MRIRNTLVLVPALALAIGLGAARAPASGLGPAAAGGAEGVPGFGHVFLIIGENTDYDHLTATNAPYLTGTIRPAAAWLTSYYAATHWSQANYVALVTGQFEDGFGLAGYLGTANSVTPIAGIWRQPTS